MKKYIIGVMLVTVHGMWGANGEGEGANGKARALLEQWREERKKGMESQVAQPAAPRQVAQPAAPRQVAQPAAPRQVAQPAAPRQVAQPAAPRQVAQPAAPRQVAQPAGWWQPEQRKSLEELIAEEARRQAAERSKPPKVPATLQELKAAVTSEFVERQIQMHYGRGHKLRPKEVQEWMRKAHGIVDGNEKYFGECLGKCSLENVVAHLLMQTRRHYPK